MSLKDFFLLVESPFPNSCAIRVQK